MPKENSSGLTGFCMVLQIKAHHCMINRSLLDGSKESFMNLQPVSIWLCASHIRPDSNRRFFQKCHSDVQMYETANDLPLDWLQTTQWKLNCPQSDLGACSE